MPNCSLCHGRPWTELQNCRSLQFLPFSGAPGSLWALLGHPWALLALHGSSWSDPPCWVPGSPWVGPSGRFPWFSMVPPGRALLAGSLLQHAVANREHRDSCGNSDWLEHDRYTCIQAATAASLGTSCYRGLRYPGPTSCYRALRYPGAGISWALAVAW